MKGDPSVPPIPVSHHIYTPTWYRRVQWLCAMSDEAVLHDRRRTNFTITSNAAVRDVALSFKARGILTYLLSHNTGWKFSIERLVEASGSDGEHAIRTGIKELERGGYLRRTQMKVDGRFTRARWEVSDNPDDLTSDNAANPQVTPDGDFPDAEIPDVENRRTLEEQELQEDQKPPESASPTSEDDLFGETVIRIPTPNQRAQKIASAVYEMTNGIGNFHNYRTLAKKAVEAGYADDRVLAAFQSLVTSGRPLCAESLRPALAGPKDGSRFVWDEHRITSYSW